MNASNRKGITPLLQASNRSIDICMHSRQDNPVETGSPTTVVMPATTLAVKDLAWTACGHGRVSSPSATASIFYSIAPRCCWSYFSDSIDLTRPTPAVILRGSPHERGRYGYLPLNFFPRFPVSGSSARAGHSCLPSFFCFITSAMRDFASPSVAWPCGVGASCWTPPGQRPNRRADRPWFHA